MKIDRRSLIGRRVRPKSKTTYRLLATGKDVAAQTTDAPYVLGPSDGGRTLLVIVTTGAVDGPHDGELALIEARRWQAIP